MFDERSNQKQNGISGHPFLPPRHGDKQTGNTRTALLHREQVPPDSLDETQQKFVFITHHGVVYWKKSELLEPMVMNRGILGLSNKVQNVQKGARLPIPWMLKERPCNSLTLLINTRDRRNIFQVRCLSKDDLRGSYGREVTLLRTRDRFHSSGLTSHGGQIFSKLKNILLSTRLAAKSKPAKKTWLRAARWPLTASNDSFSSLHRYNNNSCYLEQWPWVDRYSIHYNNGGIDTTFPGRELLWNLWCPKWQPPQPLLKS